MPADTAAQGGEQKPELDPEELKRKYKRLDKNQKDWDAQTAKDLQRQKRELGNLKKDNEQLEQQIARLQGTYGHRPGSAGTSGPGAGKRIQRARELDGRKDMLRTLEDKIAMEDQKIEEFESKIKTIKSKIGKARAGMGGINITKESNLMIDKQIKVLENRLDKALVKFNEALHINKELREQIDNLRRERGVFDTIYKKLERELQEKKKEMAFIIEVSNIAYEERDNATNELTQLKLYAAKEMQSFEETFKELDELLEEDRKMKEAIKQRMNERKDKTGDKSPTDEESKANKRRQQQALNGKPTPQTPSRSAGAELSPQNYEEAFNKIKAATNISDINLLVSKFLHSEDDNFSLFNYVNELNNEIEKLEDARNEIRSELERVKGANGGQGDQGRKAVLKGLEEKLNTEQGNSKRFAEMADKTTKLVEQIIACVDKIFNQLECEESRIIAQQGTAGLSENNLHLYLAAIELKTDEHLMRWRRMHGTHEKGPSFPFGSTNISIDIPSTGDDYNDGYSDEEERVLTRDELLQKTNQKISKQQPEHRVRNKQKKQKKTQPIFPPPAN
eukprot:TRINITY_DN20706_c0_g1_i1.p1 TRINITY_DN20706_c0_g1~~TRINITY_DN20706_c0_g1_i1.p1  ORF type:complete len:563 (-),score=120.03 TRINITY_DN20706_c0_g1_i1:100-1788(-)